MRWVLLLVVLASCSRSQAESDVGPEAERAFYYWRTTFALSARERTALVDAQVTKLYVRTFDLDWNATENRAVVLGGLTASEPAPPGVEVVPVVFIKQDVFKHAGGARELAQLTWAEVSRRVKPLGVVPRELQLDCDWTDTTRDRFFAYVREVRAASHVALSATIRLHQIKYRERTGVPPVDRGMLMFYNMGSFSADVGSRAIFDPAIAEQYLGRVSSYPLALDLALPVWSWTLQLRDDMPVNLLQSTDPDELPAVDFLDAAGPDRFVATRSAFLHGAMIREGDILKVERMRPAAARAAGAQIAPHLPAGTRTISLFDLSERNLDRYGTDDLDQIFHAR
ncbi:MAG: hypothetical protein ABI867_04745 [Kofleriaceae bacterium]